jgi:trimethylamine--corrinoid protein Co-methyltransferase
LELAKKRVAEILDTHKPTPLTSEQEAAVEDILNEARNYYRKKGLISEEELSDYMKVIGSPGM